MFTLLSLVAAGRWRLSAVGADVAAVDVGGLTAVEVAGQYGNEDCQRLLMQFTWQQRAAATRPRQPPALLPHQRFDSALHASLSDGPHAQVLRAHQLHSSLSAMNLVLDH